MPVYCCPRDDWPIVYHETWHVYLVDKIRGTIVKTLEPSIFVAEHGHHVITAFPTNTSKCK